MNKYKVEGDKIGDKETLMGGKMKHGAVSTQNAATIGKKDVGGPSNPLKKSSSSSTPSQSQVI